MAEFGMMFYMFVLGLEMDPYVISKPPTRSAKIAYAGLFLTFILACSTTPFLQYYKQQDLGFTLSLSITLSGSGSHILTRVITNLKIGKSDIGKLVIAAGVHNDMISMILMSIAYLFAPPSLKVDDIRARITMALRMGAALLLQTIFTATISPIFMNWVNNQNPEGKPMKVSHLVLAMAFMYVVCIFSPIYGYNPILSAFIGGIFLPSEGRVSKWAIGKINYLLTIVFYPIFFLWVGYNANFQKFEANQWGTWGRLLVLVVITIFGKVAGTIICGAILGFHWRESAELGFLLTTKGHFHVYLAVVASVVCRFYCFL